MTFAFSIIFSFLTLLSPGNNLASKIITNDADTVAHKGKAKVLVFPTPTVSRLFYIQRDPNTNTIIYDLNTDKAGQLNKDEPVHVYWIKYNEKAQKEELNFIQRKFAYGISTKPIGGDKYDVRIVAYKKYPLVLKKWDSDNKYHIFATIDKKEAMVNRIFLKIEGGTFWFPNVVYIEVKGTDPATGKEVMERFKP
jgi:hypothetical protein